MVIALAGFLLWVVFNAITAILPFALAFLMALIIAPTVDRIQAHLPWREQRPELNRSLAIAVVYATVLGALVVVGIAVIPTVAAEVSALIDETPAIIDRAEAELDEVIVWYRDAVPQGARSDIEDGLSDVGGRVGEFIVARFAGTIDFVVGGLFSIIGYVVIPFFLFYLLKDGHKLRVWFLRLFPPGMQADAAVVLDNVQRTFAAYLRAQLTLGLVIAIVTGLGLWIMGVRFPVALALAAGVTELIPFIGPFLGFVPALAVVLATDPEKWWWLIIFYMAVQQLEGQILVPIVHGHAVTMHPAAIIALVLIGGAVFGFAGTILIVPAAAAARDTYGYIYRRLNNDLPPPGLSPPERVLAPAAAAAPIDIAARAPPRIVGAPAPAMLDTGGGEVDTTPTEPATDAVESDDAEREPDEPRVAEAG